MDEIGEVIEKRGSKALVKINRYSACSECKKKCALAGTTEKKEVLVEVENKIGACRGQKVKLEMEEKNMVLSALIVYLFPLIGMIIGYFIGVLVALDMGVLATEVVGIIGSLIFLGLAFLLIKLINVRLERSKGFQPKITGFYNSQHQG